MVGLVRGPLDQAATKPPPGVKATAGVDWLPSVFELEEEAPARGPAVGHEPAAEDAGVARRSPLPDDQEGAVGGHGEPRQQLVRPAVAHPQPAPLRGAVGAEEADPDAGRLARLQTESGLPGDHEVTARRDRDLRRPVQVGQGCADGDLAAARRLGGTRESGQEDTSYKKCDGLPAKHGFSFCCYELTA